MVTFCRVLAYRRAMRTTLAALLAILVTNCGAEAPSTGGDAGGSDAPAADAAPLCPRFPLSMDQDCDGNPANGCERRVTADPMNCGGCGIVCTTSLPRCIAGVCGP